MIGSELRTMTQSIVDDTIEETLFYQLLNVAKNRREDSRPWQYLKKLDSSKTASVGDTYETAKALPADFRYDYLMMVGTDTEYLPVPFEEQHIYKNAAHRYFIDLAGSNFYLTGKVNVAKTIYLFYIKTTDDIVAATSWSAPARFHPLLAFDVAGFITAGVDADDLYARMSPEHKIAAKQLEDSMIAWDTQLKLRAMNRSFAGRSEDTGVPVGEM